MVYTPRLNTFYLDTSYLGLYTPAFYMSVNGVDVTNLTIKPAFRIRQSCSPGAVSDCKFATRSGSAPVTPGHEVIVRDGGAAGKIVFAGHALPRKVTFKTRSSIMHDIVVAQDYKWFMDRFALVNKSYHNQPVNGIVNDILTNYTNGGFRIGNVSSSLGSVAMTFTFEPVSRCLDRIAAAVNGFVDIAPNKNVSILTSISDGHAITLNNSSVDFWNLEYEEDLTQVRTRTIVEGQGAALVNDLSINDTTVTLDDASWANPSGGKARINQQTVDYTGVSGNTLTGLSGHADASQGDAINLIIQADYGAAQSAMATLLGGGASGIITHYIQDRRLSRQEASVRATNDVIAYSAAIERAVFQSRNRTLRPCKSITFDLTTPRTINTTLTIEMLEIRLRGKVETGSFPQFEYTASCTPRHVTLPALLAGVADHGVGRRTTEQV